ncbi:MAG: hypothetical protein PHD10_04970 [Bacilli bacterium]|nr:hypothetical protein [Bacilli bacterium]MDD4608462.1 hypothetical protein [Bacilli bacterium]
MALFKSKEEKDQENIEIFMKKYHLENIDQEDLEILKRVANDLAGNGLFKAGLALSFAKVEEQAKITYLSALVEQNWLIIRQLSKINQNIKANKNSSTEE